MSEYVKTIGQIRKPDAVSSESGSRDRPIRYCQVGQSSLSPFEQEAANQESHPFQFHTILNFLKQQKEEKSRRESDMESTRSSDSDSRIQATTLIQRQKKQEDQRQIVITRLKKCSLFIAYVVGLGLALHSLTGFGANCKRNQAWNIFTQDCDCNADWEQNVKGICVPKCSHNRLYNEITEECRSCNNSWQHVVSGNICTDRCSGNQVWFEADNQCGECPDYWQWVLKDNKCVDRCRAGRSYNRYMNDEENCLDLYDLFDDVASDNDLIERHRLTGSMGGSLSQRLDCGLDTLQIETPFSEKRINLTGYQYVEFVSSTDPQLSYHEKTRMLMSKRDYRKFDLIIDTEDNESNQCYTNERACWLELIKFEHQDDIYFVKEGFKSDGTNTIVIEGQWRFKQDSALIRITDAKGTELSWRSNNQFNGKTFEILDGQDKCQKQIYQNNDIVNDYQGSDMKTPF